MFVSDSSFYTSEDCFIKINATLILNANIAAKQSEYIMNRDRVYTMLFPPVLESGITVHCTGVELKLYDNTICIMLP